jgi:hypothetical protein
VQAHAVSITVICFPAHLLTCALVVRSLWQELNPMQLMGVLLAALVHDIDHPGLSNQFLINTDHELAYARLPPRGAALTQTGPQAAVQ